MVELSDKDFIPYSSWVNGAAQWVGFPIQAPPRAKLTLLNWAILMSPKRAKHYVYGYFLLKELKHLSKWKWTLNKKSLSASCQAWQTDVFFLIKKTFCFLRKIPKNLLVDAGILRDKTMADKLMNILNDDTQNCLFLYYN